MIAEVGSFFVGGSRVTLTGLEVETFQLSSDLPEYVFDPNGTFDVDHAYVQYFIPVEVRHPPAIFVHGGGMTGAVWETTPDGRPGWLTSFLRAGWPCYVVDNVERGRAGWASSTEIWPDRAITRSEQEIWDVFRIGRPNDYESRVPFPDSVFPVKHLADLTRQTVPRWTTHGEQSIAAVVELARRLERCVIIGHSQCGGFAAHATRAATRYVEAAVLLEPHGLPLEGASRDVPHLLVMGDHIDESPFYIELRKAWHAFARSSPMGVQLLDLPATGRKGGTHLPMCDLDSDDVARLVQEWLVSSVTTGDKP